MATHCRSFPGGCLKTECFAMDFSCARSHWSAAERGPVYFPNPHSWQAARSREEPCSGMSGPEKSRRYQHRQRRWWFASVFIRRVCCRAVPIAGEQQNHLRKPAVWPWKRFTQALCQPDPGEKLCWCGRKWQAMVGARWASSICASVGWAAAGSALGSLEQGQSRTQNKNNIREISPVINASQCYWRRQQHKYYTMYWKGDTWLQKKPPFSLQELDRCWGGAAEVVPDRCHPHSQGVLSLILVICGQDALWTSFLLENSFLVQKIMFPSHWR